MTRAGFTTLDQRLSDFGTGDGFASVRQETGLVLCLILNVTVCMFVTFVVTVFA